LCAAVSKATPGLDVVKFSLADELAFVRLPIRGVPNDRVGNSDRTADKEQRAPSERCDDPEKERTEERQTRILADGIDTVGAGALLLREPGAEDTAVGGEARRLGNAEPKSEAQEAGDVLCKAVHQRKQGPDGKRQPVRDTRPEPVEHHAAGYLRYRVGP
jgi:hypothetical protein